GPVVVHDLHTGRRELRGDPVGGREDLLVLAGGHQMYVGRGDVARPAQAELEDVAHLDAARRLENTAVGDPAHGAGVAVAHVGNVDDAVAGEVAAGDE